MAAITRISNAAAIAAIDAITALLDVGGAGRIDIMDGTQPSDVSVAIGVQVVLASLTLNATAFNPATDQAGYARAVAYAITQDTAADAAGTATWFRAYNGSGTAIIDGNVGIADEALVLNNVAIALNDTVSISPWNIDLSET
jgi:hypothetical protein